MKNLQIQVGVMETIIFWLKKQQKKPKKTVRCAAWCDVQDSAVSVLEWDTTNKGNKYMVDNPFLVRTPSTTVVDMQGFTNCCCKVEH